ncbi:MAG: protein kinase [Planctomycetes bacterium]|nr:protein kinase [Planctomycetota bacterium]
MGPAESVFAGLFPSERTAIADEAPSTPDSRSEPPAQATAPPSTLVPRVDERRPEPRPAPFEAPTLDASVDPVPATHSTPALPAASASGAPPDPGSATLLPILVGNVQLSAAPRQQRTMAALDGPEPGAAGPPPAPLPVDRPFGKYHLIEELGRGGMGVVYKAWRADLRAHYALKVLLAGYDASPDTHERFRREAQASARLHHPGIVSVHDIGIEEGKAYYAMEYVQGESLYALLEDPGRAGLPAPPPARRTATGIGGGRARRRGLAVRDAARIASEVAEAIEHAHRQGVIHRDLKPGNVLIDRDGRARVLDFGLAKLLEREQERDPQRVRDRVALSGVRTQTGVVMGTLVYMPPEQASGAVHQIDERTDVYALGAMLYEMVTGAPPFQADSDVELLGRVLSVDPLRPRARNPDVPPDLETIIQKAMAKEQDRRYRRAGELAADLHRFLVEEPILARPPSVTYRLSKWVVRRRGLVAAVLVLAAAGGVAGGAAWRVRRAEEEQAALVARAEQDRAERAALRARVLRELRERAAVYVDAALTLRRSGVPMTKAETTYLPLLRKAVEEAVREDPERAEPHYQLGRLCRSLLRFDEAREQQSLALGKEPGFAPSLYEHALLLLREYRERRAALLDAWWRDAGQRLAAAGLLAGEAGKAAASLPAPPSEVALTEGDVQARDLRAAILRALVGLDTGSDAAGAARVPAAVAGDASTPPAALSSVAIDCARGLRLATTSSRPEDRAAARALLDGVVRADPSIEDAYETLAQIAEQDTGRAAAIAIYSQGLEVDKGYFPFWLGRAALRMNEGSARAGRGEDPTPYFAPAESDLERALALHPDGVAARLRLGALRSDWGKYRMDSGQDPSDLHAKADADFAKVLALEPANAEAWLLRGITSLNTAYFDRRVGRNPEPGYRRAAELLTHARDLSPQRDLAWTSAGILHMNWALYAMDHGAESEGLFAQSVGEFDAALARRPDSAEIWLMRGLVRTNWGNSRLGRGEDPSDIYARAAADCDKALELEPASAPSWMRRGLVELNRGFWSYSRGRDPEPNYAEAERRFARALELNPKYAEAFSKRGRLRMNWAYHRAAHGQDPEPLYAGAVEDQGRAIELNPSDFEGWRERATVRLNWGGYRMGCGGDPTALYGKAEDDFEQALRLNAASAETWYARGAMRMNWGTYRKRKSENPEKQYAWAEEDLGKAVELNPQAAQAWLTRGALRSLQSLVEGDAGRDPGPRRAAALEDLSRAVRLNGRSAEAHWRRGALLYQLGRWQEAIADFEEATRLNPSCAPMFKEELADARAKVAAGGR